MGKLEGGPAPQGAPEIQLVQGIITDIQQINNFYIQQKINFGEAITGGCCEQQNGYTVYENNANPDARRKIFRVSEDSEGCNRCFCAPCHTFDLDFIPIDREDIKSRFFNRVGCCDKWLCCCTCSEFCQVTGLAFANNMQTQNGYWYIYEEKINNCCDPQIMIFECNATEKQPIAMIQCNFMFGGCAECCFDFVYMIFEVDPQTAQSNGKQIASLVKIKPQGLEGMLRECCTDSDNFTCAFNPDYPMDTKARNAGLFKATCLAAVFFLDYMFFEYDNEMVYCENNALHITLVNCYCNGMIWPCQIVLKNDNGGG